MADLIENELCKFSEKDKVEVFFSAHGVPKSYVEQYGDPYKEEIEQCVNLIMERLRQRDISNSHTLAYQSRVGPVSHSLQSTPSYYSSTADYLLPVTVASVLSKHDWQSEASDSCQKGCLGLALNGKGMLMLTCFRTCTIDVQSDAFLQRLTHLAGGMATALHR